MLKKMGEERGRGGDCHLVVLFVGVGQIVQEIQIYLAC